MRIPGALVVAGAVFVAAGCSNDSSTPMPQPTTRLTSQPFGTSPDGQPIDVYKLSNLHGMEIRVMTYGGIIVSLKTPDKAGQAEDVVLGHDDAAAYFTNPPFLGAIIGRYGNRIAKGKFTLDGREYTLATNNGANHLHGGKKGWDQAMWHAEPFQDGRGVGVVLTHTSPDGDEGYPGTVKATVTYTLTDANELKVDYLATTDKPTVINLTQHSYFNLSGGKTADILGHQLMLAADKYTPVDDGLIPTGELAPVQGTPFDFRQVSAIGARIDQKDVQLERGKGYDHNFVLTRQGDGLQLAARVVDPASGRTMEISTTEPGIQFYSGNFLDGTLTNKGGGKIGHRAGFCLETQHYPDSPNHANFPSAVLRPGQDYKTTTVFKFGAQ
jgi:aldose 1-epimerase